jgi:hypothetical protein
MTQNEGINFFKNITTQITTQFQENVQNVKNLLNTVVRIF